jgi:hypothetical protein
VGSLAQAQGIYSYPGIGYSKGIIGGVYTPTITHVLNVSASTASPFQWFRNGDSVVAAGSVSITNTGAGTVTFRISVPVPVDFTSAGSGNGETVISVTSSAVLSASAATDTLETSFVAGAGTRTLRMAFHYPVSAVI